MRTPAIALAVVCTPVIALAQSYTTAVPAFFALTQQTDGRNYDWNRLNESGVPIIVVPQLDTIGSGTGGSGCTSSPITMFDCMRTSAHKVLGYVTTNGGARDEHQVMGTAFPPDTSQRKTVVRRLQRTHRRHLPRHRTHRGNWNIDAIVLSIPL
jgi:hypothetical protein